MKARLRPFRMAAVVGLGLIPALALAQTPPAPPPAPVMAADAEELDRFRATLDRYEQRMTTFDEDARDFVRQVEAQERATVDEIYGTRLTDLDDRQGDLRGEAIRRFEAFLRKYPTGPHTAHAMFRLGDLYYEKTEADFIVDSAEYERMMEDFDFDTATEIPEAPQKDYARSIALYRRIISNHPDYRYIDGSYYMLGFCLARDGSLQWDEEESRDVFQALVDNYPESRFAVAAHLRLGEYYFDYNDIEQAIPHYEAVIRLAGTDGELYDEGLYKLAWSKYKLSQYDEALQLFTDLLDWSQGYFERTGFESPTAPEAVEYTAISFSDVSDVTGETPLQAAQRFYSGIGEREFEREVYVRLATVLTDQARFEDAIEVYRYLQDRWPDDAENPTHQWRIAQVYYVLEDQYSAQTAIQALTERYNDDSTWWTANREDPDAQNVARNYIEKSLAAVATGYHNQGLDILAALAAAGEEDPAQEAQAKEAFAKAADMYGQYLRKFPFAEDYYEIQWYRADTLLKTDQHDDAETEYVQLLKADGHPYRDGLLWNLMQVRRQRLQERYQTFDERPEDAVEESRVTLESGRERVLYALSEDHTAFIEAAEELLDADLTVPDYVEAVDNNRVPLKYIIAQIYFHHGHYDEARPRLDDLIYTHPEWDEAAFAASMMINSYQDEQNLSKVQLLAAEYAGLPLGGGKKEREFSDLAEGASFKLAEQLIAKDRLEAAQAFEQFMRDYPRSKYITDAHYNAANNYEMTGRVDAANRLFKQYIDNIEAGVYEQDERSRALYFRIASNYADVLDLENAIRYYEALYQRFPDYQDASAAVYNAAFLRIGLEDHQGAAENLERYSNLDPAPDDAEQVLFTAGEQWELVGQDQALAFYQRYLRQYPSVNPDHVMEAHYRIAMIREAQGNQRQIDRAWEDLAKAYERLAPTGEVGPLGRKYAANSELRILAREFDDFAAVEWSRNEARNVTILLEEKPAARQAVEDHALQVVNAYGDFDASTQALYYLGMSYLLYADMLYDAPPPRGLDQEGLDIYYEEVDKRRLPVEDKGRLRLEAIVDKAQEEKRWSEWVTKTVNELADRFPSDFAVEKQELRGVGDSVQAPFAGPVEFELAEEPPAEAPADGPAPAEGSQPSEGATLPGAGGAQ